MIIIEEDGDLFEVDKKYSLVHCISLDCEMGKGIAIQFSRRFPSMKSYLSQIITRWDLEYPTVLEYPFAIQKVFNLITKKNYWDKPTYRDIEIAIQKLAFLCSSHNIKYLAMPRIGCGLDNLSWTKVKKMIEFHFKDNDIEIIIRNKRR